MLVPVSASFWLALYPRVETLDATEIRSGTAKLNGEVLAINDTAIVERGFEWGFSSGSYEFSWTETGSWGVGTFHYVATNLPNGVYIYFRAKAKNSAGYWGYGNEKYFIIIVTYKVEGYCLDESGNPVVGAVVKLYNAQTDAYEASTTSDSTGKYSFTGLSNNNPRYVLAWREDGQIIVGGSDVLVPEEE